jgi:hypothetical protein
MLRGQCDDTRIVSARRARAHHPKLSTPHFSSRICARARQHRAATTTRAAVDNHYAPATMRAFLCAAMAAASASSGAASASGSLRAMALTNAEDDQHQLGTVVAIDPATGKLR